MLCMECRVWHSLQCGELQPVAALCIAWLHSVIKCVKYCRYMTNKSYTNKVYYSFIKSYHQHDITLTWSNEVKVRRYSDTTCTDFYGNATRSTEIFIVDPVSS